jgi:hypothetical protein
MARGAARAARGIPLADSTMCTEPTPHAPPRPRHTGTRACPASHPARGQTRAGAGQDHPSPSSARGQHAGAFLVSDRRPNLTGQRITRDTVPRSERTGCTDSTGNRTDGTRRAGTIKGPVPRTVPRPRSSSSKSDGPHPRAGPARIWPANPVTRAPRPVSVTTARCRAGSAVVAQTRRCATPSRLAVPGRGLFRCRESIDSWTVTLSAEKQVGGKVAKGCALA